MGLFKRLVVGEEGQGMTEYALILALVVLGIWIFLSDSGISAAITAIFSSTTTVVENCASGNCG